MNKKIVTALVASSFIASSLLADIYVGVEYGNSSNKTKYEESGLLGNESEKFTNKYSDIKLKLGTGTDGGVKAHLYLSSISYKHAIFDDSHKRLTEFGVEVIKEFEVTKEIYPFVKGGLGVGSMSVDGMSDSSILAVSLSIGGGVAYKVTENISLLAGVDYAIRKWQDIEYKTTGGTTFYTVEITDAGVKPYVGVNFQF
ncbi:MAG: hypothetical protein RBR59_01900 [Sulfurimonadaceae bacterium]|jgi:opacity protein-like surface antigen|nr:hypothetical protein [Sulfurimonadaceae bacterium]